MRTRWMILALAITGCSALFNVDGYEVEGQPDDAGQPGADAGQDSGVPHDFDASAPDAAVMDAGTLDSGSGGLPDLTISCGSPAEIVKGGDVIRVPWTVGNLGSAPSDPVTVAVLMERPAMSDDESDELVEVGTVRIPTRIPADGREDGEVAFTAPDWTLGGENVIRCVVDASDEIAEEDEANNGSDSFFRATGLPDLVALSLSVRETRRSGADYTTTIGYTVRNNGVTAARTIDVRVSTDVTTTGGGASCGWELRVVPALLPATSATGTVEITWATETCFGYVANAARLSVDFRNEIPESNETNNSRQIGYDPSS